MDAIISTHILQEHVEFWVAFRIVRHFKQWKKDVGQVLLEVIHQLV
jgi:hypothetical protein